MCENMSLFDKLKSNHELHFVIISFIIYYLTKNVSYAALGGGTIYFVMRSMDKKKELDSALTKLYRAFEG